MMKIEKTNELTRPALAEVRRPYEISAAIAAPTFLAGDTWAAEAYPTASGTTTVAVYAPDTLACDDAVLAYVLPKLFVGRAAEVHICAADDGTDPRCANSTSWSRLREYLEKYDCAGEYTRAYLLPDDDIAFDSLQGWNAICCADYAIAIYTRYGGVAEFAWYVDEDRVAHPDDNEELYASELLNDSLRRLDDFDAVPEPVVRALRLYAEGNDGLSDRYTGGNDLLNASEELRRAAENLAK